MENRVLSKIALCHKAYALVGQTLDSSGILYEEGEERLQDLTRTILWNTQ